MRNFIGIILFSFSFSGCFTDKTCSGDDKSCSPEAMISSYLAFSQDAIYIYSTNQKFQGNLAAYGTTEEESLQNICKNEKFFSGLANQFCPNVQAIVSTANAPLFDYSSEYGVPGNVNILGPTGILIADNWSAFFGSSAMPLKTTLSAAGLGSELFWTFSDSAGNQSSDCSSGNSKDFEIVGSIGTPNSTAVNWLNGASPNTSYCDKSLRILCICYIAGESAAL
ncbi:hypothetical protein [Leptospira sarikeiensis]|uniref:DUF1554 domain-containing protein n=1 Tax=Leptospira sarikeiensis TaxID=2484943 RepID=A0A4R9K6Y1_9LEPT|nr:hypothetical protein [Leptospira sarikeiensis]TGL61397.1 hypothetical protein EHQ64_10440 [Leptospira sarikeiensis]